MFSLTLLLWHCLSSTRFSRICIIIARKWDCQLFFKRYPLIFKGLVTRYHFQMCMVEMCSVLQNRVKDLSGLLGELQKEALNRKPPCPSPCMQHISSSYILSVIKEKSLEYLESCWSSRHIVSHQDFKRVNTAVAFLEQVWVTWCHLSCQGVMSKTNFHSGNFSEFILFPKNINF